MLGTRIKIGSSNTGSGRLAYSTRDAHELRHGCVTAGSNGSAVLAEGRSDGVLATVLVHNLEVMLEELNINGVRIVHD